MPMTERQVIRTLNRLYRLCIAGERGFESIAQNVSNRGLKVLLKSCAQRRAEYAGQLAQEIQKRGGSYSHRRSLRGIIHRGRINIRAALTIGPQNVENVVLGEAQPGENAVVKAYQGALRKELPSDIKVLLEQQLADIQATGEEVRLLRGQSGKRLVVRLFDSEADAGTAIQELEEAGYPQDDIELEDVGQDSFYEVASSTVSETVISGAFGGALWGTLIGTASGIGTLFIPNLEPMMGVSTLTAWASIAVAGLFFGALIGGILGFLIGQGSSEEDLYLYDDSVRYGLVLLRLNTDADRATEAARILHRVNAAARARSGSSPTRE